jgi:hypothetical protein
MNNNNSASGQVVGLSLLLQLQRRVRDARTLDEAAFIAVNETKSLLEYRQAALWLIDGGVTAISGLPLPERQSPYLQWLHNLSTRLPDQQPAPFAITKDSLPDRVTRDWHEWWPENGLALPLRQAEGAFLGFLLLARDDAWTEAELPLATELASMYGHACALHLKQRPLYKRFFRAMRRNRVTALILLILISVMFIPIHLSVLAPAEVTAKDPFLVRAPQDGVIESFHVRPNQDVTEGQLLFRMDRTNLSARLGMARKAYEVAAEEYRQSAVLALQDDRGKLEMAPRRGKMEERAAELSGTSKLLNRLEAVAPRDGIAIFSDPTDWVGKGVSIGEKVLLIADPDKAELLIRLPVADAIALNPGTRIILYLSSDPRHPKEATLTSASFRAELLPGGVVGYRLKGDFSDMEELPRIGLSGTAKLYGEKVLLGYALLRRPITAVRQRLGW